MRRTLQVRQEVWPLARPFTISRGSKSAAEVVVAEIAADGVVGRGECVPYPRYGETCAGVMKAVRAQSEAVAAGLDREQLLDRMPPGAARNALDCALWDLEAKAQGWQVPARLGLGAATAVVTAQTVALGPAPEMAAAAAAIAARAPDRSPLLKLKLDGSAIVDRVDAVRRAAPRARLIVDANEAWSMALLAHCLTDLAALGVDMIEQPLPAGEDDALEGFTSPITLCADESCHAADDLPRLAGKYRMVNVKLDKAGGLTAAAQLVHAARPMGFAIMVGCMVGTSLAMAPAMALVGSATYVDLDGPLWLAADRTPALRFEDGLVFPPDRALWG